MQNIADGDLRYKRTSTYSIYRNFGNYFCGKATTIEDNTGFPNFIEICTYTASDKFCCEREEYGTYVHTSCRCSEQGVPVDPQNGNYCP